MLSWKLALSLTAYVRLADAARVKHGVNNALAASTGSTCCCNVGSSEKGMATYEAIKGDMFHTMHFYAEPDKSTEQIGAIALGAKVWALNPDPQTKGWLELAYVKNGNVGTGWSSFKESRFKFVEMEQVKQTQCSIAETCSVEEVTVPGNTDQAVCETFLNDVPVPSSKVEEWRKDAPNMLKEARDLYVERHTQLTTSLPEQAEYRITTLEGLKQALQDSEYCLMWPPWCVFKHFQLSHHWTALKSVIRKMVRISVGHEEASEGLHANLAALHQAHAQQKFAERIATLERELIVAELKVLDGSSAAQAFAYAATSASTAQYKAFCSGRPYFEALPAETWLSPEWWTDMFDECSGEGLTPDELLSLQHDADKATDLPDARDDSVQELQEKSVIRSVVASDRGVSLVQVQDGTKNSTSSLVDRTQGEQGTQDGGDAILVFLFLTACGCSAPVALGGAFLAA